jgi:hypothetical protein
MIDFSKGLEEKIFYVYFIQREEKQYFKKCLKPSSSGRNKMNCQGQNKDLYCMQIC